MGQAEDHATLLTGATGFLGGEVLARLLERGEGPVYALVRAADEESADARLQSTVRALVGDRPELTRRAIAVRGDVCEPGLGIDPARRRELAERVTRIAHCAASVSFTLALEPSRQINVEGTRRILDLAQECRALELLTHVSTSYVSGDHQGVFTEADLDVGQRHHNPYERSKFEAEQLVRARFGSVPTQVVRPSIVVGDSRSGWTPAFNVMYWPLKALARGHYRMLPLRRSAPLDVVPVDFVADGMLAAPPTPGATWHLTAGERASTTGAVLGMAERHLDVDPTRVVSPAVYRRLLHPLLLLTSGRRRRQTLRATEAFFPYFDVRVRYDNRRTLEALAGRGIAPPPLEGYFDRLMDYAEEARWGKEPVQRHRTFAPATEGSAAVASG